MQVCTNCNSHKYPFHMYLLSLITASSEDFQANITVLTFQPMNHESCVTVAITDSVALEMPESFFVTLKKPAGLDERIAINTARDETEVEIIDDDGEYDDYRIVQ